MAQLGGGGGGGGGAGASVTSEYSSRLGDPLPAPVTRSGVAELTMALLTVGGVAVGWLSRYNAATPATCGVAIDVPLIVLVAVSDVFHADVMLDPGAKTSTHVPKFENDARASVFVVAPTTSASATRDGEPPHALALLLPAAIA